MAMQEMCTKIIFINRLIRRWDKIGRKEHKRYYHLCGIKRYKDWRMSVFLRDNFLCRLEDENCFGMLQAHHILKWSDFPKLRYKLNNGITLCQAHHPRKWAEEKRLAPIFSELVSVSTESKF
jgi:5-methylcytosine-specific restriction endonuclease McrA